MATTTNYSWTTPDDTALVKDGAAAIRSLGTAIDTTVFNNASAGIAKTIVDAKGDIIAATAADTVSRLAVGANDTVLTADSTAGTGLKWATPASGGMTLLSTTTLSGSSTTVSVASNTYVYLVAIVDGVTTSQNCNVFIQINSITGATAYRPLQQGSDGNTLTACNGIYLTVPNAGPALGTGNANNVWVNTFGNPNSTSMQTINTQGSWTYTLGGYDVAMTNQVTVNPSAVISSLVFKCDFTFGGGTVKLYGVK